MKALIIRSFGSPAEMALADLPEPVPAAGEIRVRVRAAALNPVDWKIREGYLKDLLPHEFPIVPGWDCAGVVEMVGPEVENFRPGDEVMGYCRKEVIRDGTFAEKVVVEPRHLAPKPPELTFEEAACLPLAGLTAWQALFDAGHLSPGQTVLVHAAAGGVGHLAVQLAKRAGANVIGTASPANHAFLRSLGVDHPVDYGDAGLAAAVKLLSGGGVDLVFDCIGGAVLENSAAFLGPEGRVITIVDVGRVDALKEKGLRAGWVFVSPNPKQLAELGKMASRGELKVEVSQVLPLESFAEAFAGLEAGHTRGKRVLRIL